MTRVVVLFAGLLAFLLAGALWGQAPDALTPPGWTTFQGSWSASGQRQALPAADDRTATTAQISGAYVLSSGEGLGKGFRGEAIAFDDGVSVSIGRCVWTDERGDRIYSELSGERMETGKRIVATITGGTGRYAGITGDYAFVWQYVVSAESGTIQGRAVSLEGRVRLGERR